MQSEHKYVPFEAYAQSKIANVMTSVELQRRCDRLQQRLHSASVAPGATAAPPPDPRPSAGAGGVAEAAVTCTAMHPGLVNTPLARDYFVNDYIAVPWLRPLLAPVLRAVFPLALLRPELSVRAVALAALGPPGEVRCRFVEGQSAGPVFRAACSAGDCARLWDVSLELAGQVDPCV